MKTTIQLHVNTLKLLAEHTKLNTHRHHAKYLPECTSMCLSRELCELRTFPQIVQLLTCLAWAVLWERMCTVKSWSEPSCSLHIGHCQRDLPSSPATGIICKDTGAYTLQYKALLQALSVWKKLWVQHALEEWTIFGKSQRKRTKGKRSENIWVHAFQKYERI